MLGEPAGQVPRDEFRGRLEVENVIEVAMIQPRLDVVAERAEVTEVSDEAGAAQQRRSDAHLHGVGMPVYLPALVPVRQARKVVSSVEREPLADDVRTHASLLPARIIPIRR